MNAFDGTPKLRPISSKKPSESEGSYKGQVPYNNYRHREHFYNNYNSPRQQPFYLQNNNLNHNKFGYANPNAQNPRSPNPSYRKNFERFNYSQRSHAPKFRNYTPRFRNHAHSFPSTLSGTQKDQTLVCGNLHENNNDLQHSSNDHISANCNDNKNYEQIFSGSGFYRNTYHNNYLNYKENPKAHKGKTSEQIDSGTKTSTHEQIQDLDKNDHCDDKNEKIHGSPKKKIEITNNEKINTKHNKEHSKKDKTNSRTVESSKKISKSEILVKKNLGEAKLKKLRVCIAKKKKLKLKVKSTTNKVKKQKVAESENKKSTEVNEKDSNHLESKIKIPNYTEKTKELKLLESNQTFEEDTVEDKNTEEIDWNISTNDEIVLFNPDNNPAVKFDLNEKGSKQEIDKNKPFQQTLRLVPLHKLMYSSHTQSDSEFEKNTRIETTRETSKNVSKEDTVIDKILSYDKSKIKRIINYPSVFDDLLLKKKPKSYQLNIRRILETLESGQNTNSDFISEIEANEALNSELMSQELFKKLESIIGKTAFDDLQTNDEPKIGDENIASPQANPSESDILVDMEDVKPNVIETERRITLSQQNLKDKEGNDKTEYSEKEVVDQFSSSLNSRRRKIRNQRKQRDMKLTELVIVDSSSSSNYSLSSDDADGDSDSSHGSEKRRQQLKKKVSEKSVVSSFDKLILPSINAGLQERYRTKCSNTVHSKLHFISCICTSNYNSEQFTKYEIAKIQRNINKEDNSHALDFLAKQIVNVFINIEKIIKRGKVLRTNINTSAPNEIHSDNNVQMTSNALNKRSIDAADEGICRLSENHTINAFNPNEMQLTPKHNQSHECLNDLETNASNSVKGPLENERNQKTGKQKRLNEKKTNNDNGKSLPSRELSLPINDGVSRNNSCIEGGGVYPHVDINLLKQNHLINDNFFLNIREIDLKLVEIHRRQMFIDEMIMKLQKDKMDANLMATQLESEKYMILNAALGANIMSNEPVSVDLITKNTPDYLNEGNFGKRMSIKSRKNIKVAMHNLKLKRPFYKSKGNVSFDVLTKKRALEDTVLDSEKQNKAEEENMKVNQINDDTLDLGTEVIKNVEHDNKSTFNSIANKSDYSDIESGYLETIKSPVTVISTIENYIIAGTEDGNIYQFNFRTLKCELRYNKHCDTITDICICPKSNLIFTTSLDGHLKISNIQNLKIDMQSVNLQEPLQTIDIQWDTGYIGTRWGNVFTYDVEANKINVSPLCSSNLSITAVKAVTEAERKVILVSSRTNELIIRDANTGILVRSLHLPSAIRISSFLLDHGTIYCGSFKKEVYKFDFQTGSHLATLMCGNGAVSMDLYKERFLLVGCYDGLIYVLDKDTNKCIAQFSGSGRMVLTLKVLGDKVITSAKNKTLQIIDIPKHVVVTAMAQRTKL